jgi:adenosylcobinamide hydrolase
MLVWRFPQPVNAIASGPLGGGIGVRHWMINATVDAAYARTDPDVHLAELAATAGLAGPGVGMLTAVDATRAVTAAEDGVVVTATVGLGHPTWAAAPDGDLRHATSTGTINICAYLPIPLADAALVNAVATATEAKAQALWEHGVEATGTATDAVFVACARVGAIEWYGGPRSTWGARLARVVRSAVANGTQRWLGGLAG